MEQDPKVTPQEFAAKIKAKYPEYKDMDDNELVKKITEKYPTYKDQINFSGEPIKKKSTTEQQPTESPSETTPSAAEQRETVGGSESNTPREFVLGKPEYASDKDKFIQESTQKALDFQKEQKAKQKIQAQNDLRLKSVTEEEINEGIKLADEKISFINNNTEAFSKKLEGLKARAEAGETIPQEEVKNLEFERKILNIAGSAAYTEKQQLLSDRVLKRSATGTFSGAAQNVMTEGWSKITQGGARLGAYLAASILPNEMVSPDLASGEKTRSEVLGELESEFISGEIGRSLSALKDDGTTPEYLARKVEESILAEVAVGVGESLPAMAGGVSSLMLYSTQVGFESVNEAAGDKLTYDQKMAYATTFGVVQGLMEKAGLDIVLNKGVMSKLTNNVIEELFNKGLKSNTKNISSILTEGATPLLRSFSGEAVTGGAQELSAVSLESLSNYLSDEEIFDKQSTSEIVSRVLKGAALEGLGGGMMATPAAIFRAGKAAIKPNGFAVAEEMVQPQNISDIYEYLDARVAAGEMSEADAQQMRLDTKASADIIESIPPEISTEKKVEAFKLIQEKKALEAEIEGKEPALVQDKIDRIKGTKKDGVETKGINQELTDLVQRTDVSNADSQVEPDVAPINDTQVEDAPVLSDTPPQDQQSEASAPISALKDVESTAKALSEHDKNTEDLETAFAVANGNMKSTDLKPSKGRDSLIPIFKKFIAEDKYVGQYRFGIIGVTETISEAYHADKAAGVETELTKAVEALLSPTETQTEATNVATNGVSEAPSQERQLEDIQNGDVISFTYNNESEVPDVFKDKISSKGELNGKKYVRVTVAKSLADYELLKQQPQVRPTEVVTEGVKEKPTVTKVKRKAKPKIDNSTEQTEKEVTQESEDFQEESERLSGIKLDLIPEDQRGQADISKMTFPKLMERGKALIDSGVINAQSMIASILSSPRSIQPDETAALIYYKAKLDNQLADVEGGIAEAKKTGDQAGLSVLEARQKELVRQQIDYYRIQEVTGYFAGLSLAARKMMLTQDYSLAAQVSLAKRASGLDNLPIEIAEKFKEYDKQLKELNKRISEHEKRVSEENNNLKSDAAKTKPSKTRAKKISDTIRSAKFVSTFNDLSKLQSSAAAPFIIAWDGSLELMATTVDITGSAIAAIDAGIKFMKNSDWYKNLTEKGKLDFDKIARSGLMGEMGLRIPEMDENGTLYIPDSFVKDLIVSGEDTIDKATKRALEILDELGLLDDIDEKNRKRVVRDAISDYGKRSKLSVEAVDKTLRGMKRVGKLLSALEDVRKKIRPLRSGVERDKLTTQETNLQKEIKELLKGIPLTSSETEAQWKSALDATKTRLKNRIAELEERRDTGKKPMKRMPIELDAEAMGYKDQIEALKKILAITEGNNSEISYEQRVAMTDRALDKAIKEYSRRIKEGDFEAVERAEPISNPAINKKRAIRDGLREVYNNLKNPPKTEAQKKNESDVKRLEKEILNTQEQIQLGIYNQKKVNQLKDSQEVLDLKSKLKGLKDKLQESDAYKAVAEQRANESELRALNAKIDKLNEQIANDTFTEAKKEAKKEKPIHIKNAKKAVEELNKLLKETESYKAVARKKKIELTNKMLGKSIDRYNERIANAEFEPKKRVEPELDDEGKKLKREQRKIKMRFDLEREKFLLKKRTMAESGIDSLLNVLALPRVLMASVDLSAPLRQGIILSAGNPRQAAKAFAKMFEHAFSQEKSDNWLADLMETDEYIFAKKMKLAVTIPGAKISAREELFVSSLAHKIPIWSALIKGSERAYSGYLNVLRVGVFNDFASSMVEMGYDPNTDTKPFEKMAAFINNATGRGNLGAIGESSEQFMNAVFFAPRYVLSRFNIIFNASTGFAGYPPVVKREAYRTIGAFLGMGFSVLALAAAMGAEIEDDIASPEFGLIKVGDMRYDIWGGLQQTVRLMYLMTPNSEKKNPFTGEVKKLNEGSYGKTRLDEFFNFLRKKLSPAFSTAADFSSAPNNKVSTFKAFSHSFEEKVYFKNIVNQEMGLTAKTVSLVSPLFLQDMFEMVSDEEYGIATGSFLPLLFGVGGQYYYPENEATTDDFEFETILDDINIEDLDTDIDNAPEFDEIEME